MARNAAWRKGEKLVAGQVASANHYRGPRALYWQHCYWTQLERLQMSCNVSFANHQASKYNTETPPEQRRKKSDMSSEYGKVRPKFWSLTSRKHIISPSYHQKRITLTSIKFLYCVLINTQRCRLHNSFFLLTAAGLGSGEQEAGLQPWAKAGPQYLDY